MVEAEVAFENYSKLKILLSLRSCIPLTARDAICACKSIAYQWLTLDALSTISYARVTRRLEVVVDSKGRMGAGALPNCWVYVTGYSRTVVR